MPTPDYSQWPVLNDVTDRLGSAGVVLRAGVTVARQEAVRQAVITEIAQRTQRQFVADADDETRYYDGPGTPEIEVDEMVSLTSVAVIGIQSTPGYAISDAQLTFEQGKPQTRITVARGSVPAFTSEGVFVPYQWLFPAGRRNIAVTGKFGFAALIPADLWDGACGEMAHRLAAEAVFSQAGRLQLRRAGDEEERYQLAGADSTGWHAVFERCMQSGSGGYKRPAGRRLRNLRNRMMN